VTMFTAQFLPEGRGKAALLSPLNGI